MVDMLPTDACTVEVRHDLVPLTERPAPWPVGVPPLAGYRILDKLGEGGMGLVYKAHQPKHNRFVAIKVLPRHRRDQSEALARFRREAEAAQRLDHPNIVKVYHADLLSGLPFLVMEYLDGIDLQRLVVRAGRLPVARACELMRQAALGLQHLHENGLVHRDVKPSNLLVTTLGGRLKILDLGLARCHVEEARGEGARVTAAGTFLGTADFVAPEQAVDASGVDIRADLYSLGGTLYYLLTGRVPFPGDTALAKVLRHRGEAPTPLEHLRPEAPAEVVALVHRLLAKRPADRLQTPAEVAEALAPWSYTSPRDEAGADSASVGLAATVVGPSATALGPALVGEGACLKGHPGGVRSLAFALDGRLFTADGDGAVQVWDATTGRVALRWPAAPGGVTALALSPEGRRVVVAGADRHVRLWDVANGAELLTWPMLHVEVTAVAIGLHGRYALVGGQDGKIRLWSLMSGRERRVFEGHRDAITGVAFLPDDRHALSAARDHTWRLWDIDTGREVIRPVTGSGVLGRADPLCLAASPHGRRVLTGGTDHLLTVWEVASGKRLARLAGHQGGVQAVAIALDGRRALTGSSDQTARLWDLPSGQELSCFRGHTDWVTHVAFAPDGRWAVTGGKDGTVRLWGLPG